jgi:hypothetical protein
MSIDVPAANAEVSASGFWVAGWAIDRGASSSSGIDAVHVYAWPVAGGGPTLLGGATYGASRPDIAAVFGPQFLSSGYNLNVPWGTIAPGVYDIATYARSTLTGTFGIVRLVRTTVKAPPSNPLMSVDLPAQGQNTSQNLTVSGWAVDMASPVTPGVDAIHVYAYNSSGIPIWLGVATYGEARVDVGAALGSSRFNASGFRLQTTTLGPGTYTLAVCAHSAVSGTFNNIKTVVFTVR